MQTSPRWNITHILFTLLVLISSFILIKLFLANKSIPAKFGDSRISPADGMTQMFVPAGEFIMGNDGGNTDEQPAHAVLLSSFWIDQTEVTNAMYALCVQSQICAEPAKTIYFDDEQYANHPVLFTSWNDAVNYCTWADRRLPTEAEWEKVATWQPTTNEKIIYPWGDDFDCKKGNFDDETLLDDFVISGEPNCDGYNVTAPVGSFPDGASPYGALDLAGNAWEWVHDAFLETDPLTKLTENYYALSPYENPQGVEPALSRYRVLRGSSWNINFGFAQASYRLWFGMDDSYDFTSFRCASSE